MRANRRTSGLFLIGLTLLFLSGAPLDSHAQIITSVDPDSVNLGETVVVTITGEGTFFHEWSSVTDSLFFGLGCWTLLAEDVLVHSPTLIDATFDLSQANPGYVNEWHWVCVEQIGYASACKYQAMFLLPPATENETGSWGELKTLFR